MFAVVFDQTAALQSTTDFLQVSVDGCAFETELMANICAGGIQQVPRHESFVRRTRSG